MTNLGEFARSHACGFLDVAEQKTVQALFVVAFTLATLLSLSLNAFSASVGKLQICKQDTEQEYDEEQQKWWRAEVVVPAGMIFVDIGMVNDNDAPPIKLRVITLQTARLSGHQRCANVSAAISTDTERFGDKFGTAYVGPLITSVAPNDGRLLNVEGQATTNGKLPGRNMAPYDGDLPEVEATIVSEFK